MTKKLLTSGFTLIELMVTLAIAAILLGYALPSFNGFVDQRNMTSRINDFVLAVNYARSEAIKTGGLVSIQAINAGDAGNEWGPGYCVVVGDPGDCNGAPLRTFAAIGGSTINGVNGFNNFDTFSFNSRGLLSAAVSGELQLCNTDVDIDPGRTLFVNMTGRASVSELICHP